MFVSRNTNRLKADAGQLLVESERFRKQYALLGLVPSLSAETLKRDAEVPHPDIRDYKEYPQHL
jgi:hypothetical protein